MSPRVGAYVCPRGVSGIEYRVSRAGVEVTNSFDIPARIESERQAMDQLLGALANANIRKADLVVTLRGFGTVHHLLPMPPARDELLAQVVDREMRRLEPGLDEPTTSWLPLPLDPLDVADGPPQRQVLAAAAPRHVVDAMESAIRAAGHKLVHLTVLPAAMQRLHEEFVGDGEPSALVAPLRDGAFLGFFIAGAMRLVVEPPLAPDEHIDAPALAEETELGAVFVRQQFRGAQLGRVALASPPEVIPDAESVFGERLNVQVARLALHELSPGGLAALGGVIDSRSVAALGLATHQRKGMSERGRALRTASFVSLAVAAAVAAFTVFTAWQARDASNRLQLARARLEQETFGLAPVRQTATQRKLIRDAVALLQLVENDRRALQQSVAAVAEAAVPPVQFARIELRQAPVGWFASIAGAVNGGSTARSVELLHEFYRELPKRLNIEDLALEQLNYGDADAHGVQFRVSFVIAGAKGS